MPLNIETKPNPTQLKEIFKLSQKKFCNISKLETAYPSYAVNSRDDWAVGES